MRGCQTRLAKRVNRIVGFLDSFAEFKYKVNNKDEVK
ncbi:MAG: hypothetical protein ACD_54C00108G0005 [uncultured bacterium]|nr:MAG: hypothetical protein ACD_54C00108G0005 [uncultured bacterium]